MFEKTDTKPIDSNEDISVGKKSVYIFLQCFHVHCLHPPSYRLPFPALLLSFCSWTHQRTFKSRSDHKLFLFKNISRLPRLSRRTLFSPFSHSLTGASCASSLSLHWTGITLALTFLRDSVCLPHLSISLYATDDFCSFFSF